MSINPEYHTKPVLNPQQQNPILADPKVAKYIKEWAKFKAEEMPGAMGTGLSQHQWLEIYWYKLGQERGKPLTDQEKPWNIPMKSDPWGWNQETWESYMN